MDPNLFLGIRPRGDLVFEKIINEKYAYCGILKRLFVRLGKQDFVIMFFGKGF